MARPIYSQNMDMGMGAGDPIASNPANGVNNIPLQGGEGMAQGVTPKEIISLLHQIKKSHPKEASQHQSAVEDMIDRVQSDDVRDKLQKIINAMQMAADPRRQTIDPATGKTDPTAPQLAEKLSQEIEQMDKMGKPSENHHSKHMAGYSTYNHRLAAGGGHQAGEKDKKKTRGNPFRVLMGQVGKLLDHGMDKHDIVRYLLKKKMWNEDTISKAVDIVRDYNKKKHREGTDDKTDKHFYHKAPEESRGKPSVQPESFSLAPIFASYNHARTVQAAEDKTIYDIKADFSKRSTGELMARGAWLKSLQDYNKDTPQGDRREAADKKGVVAELKAIRAALEERGFDADELF